MKRINGERMDPGVEKGAYECARERGLVRPELKGPMRTAAACALVIRVRKYLLFGDMRALLWLQSSQAEELLEGLGMTHETFLDRLLAAARDRERAEQLRRQLQTTNRTVERFFEAVAAA